jgi:hypothetical protein
MMRTWKTALGLVVCGLLIAGCDTASSGSKKVEEGAKKVADKAKELGHEAKEDAKIAAEKTKEVANKVAEKTKEAAKEVAEKAKTLVIKPIEEGLPKIEEKIKGLSGDAATKAKEKLADFKKLLEQFKDSAPEKWESLKEGLAKAYDELKKLVGLEK